MKDETYPENRDREIIDYCLLCGQDVPVLEHVKKFGHGLYGTQGEHPLTRQQIFDFGFPLKPRAGEIFSRVRDALQEKSETESKPESYLVEHLKSRIGELERLLAENLAEKKPNPLEPPAGDDPFELRERLEALERHPETKIKND